MNIRVPFAVSTLVLFSKLALAGPYTDDLGKCLVAATTTSDRVALARWMFIGFSAHPDVAPISAVKPGDIDKANAEIGGLFMKLLTDSCREKTKIALRFEGPAAIQLGFQTLGQVAGMELASSPSVQARLSGVKSHVDESKFKELTTEPLAVAPK
jgi:hypothetical protein